MGRPKLEITKGFKSTNSEMKCRDFQYKLGKWYKEDRAELCSKGFHFCENPLDILNYYDLTDGKFFEVEEKECDYKNAWKELNRNFIGIEIDKNYFDIAKERIENAKTQESLILNEGDK